MRNNLALPASRGTKNASLAFGLLVAGMFVAYAAAQSILENDLTDLAYVGVIFLGGAVVVAILNNWQRGLYLITAWILFEDFFRKYLGNNMAIYFAKDVLALVLYLSFFRARMAKRIENFKIPFRVPLMIFFWFCLIQIFNPASTSFYYGILGMKLNFIYIPMFYVGYAFVDSEENLRKFFSFICILVLIVGTLGLIQSIVGPTFLNPKVLQDEIRDLSLTYRASPLSGLIAYRPTSVFVSAGRFQDFLMVSWMIVLGFCGYLLLRTKKSRTLASVTLGVVAAASLMSASRGVFMWNAGTTIVMTAGFLWGAPWRQREAIRVLRAIQRTVLLIGIGLMILLTIFPNEIGSRLAIYSETLMPDSPASELVKRTQTYPLLQLEYAFQHPRWPYGYGLGTCSLGAQYVIRIMHVNPVTGIGVESGFGNLIVELGIVGPILWIFLGVAISVSAWRVVIKLRGTPWFPLAFAIFLYAFILMFPMMFTGISPYQDFVLNENLWLLLGVLYRLVLFPESFQAAAQFQTKLGQV